MVNKVLLLYSISPIRTPLFLSPRVYTNHGSDDYVHLVDTGAKCLVSACGNVTVQCT